MESSASLSLSILENESITRDTRLLRLDTPEISHRAKPGQFVMIEVGSEFEHLPPRPFSFCQITPEKNSITIVYKLGGRGTQWLSTQKKGTTLTVLGPLGHGFSVPAYAKHVALVGGGIGVTPLICLGEKLTDRQVSFFLGLRTKAAMTITDELLSFIPENRRYYTTEDGTLGEKGYVTARLSNFLEKNHVDYIAACGPKPMHAALAVVSKKLGVPAEVAIETSMPCGIGVCGECIVTINADEREKQILACVDGPVLPIDKLIL